MLLASVPKPADISLPNGVAKVETLAESPSLVGELERARKEVVFTSARIQDLEDALRKERQMREAAEDRAAQLEIATRTQLEAEAEEAQETCADDEDEDHTVTIDAAALAASMLQARMEEIMVELKTVKSEMRAFKLRAEAAELRADRAEKERDAGQKSLAETIQAIRREEDRRSSSGTQTDALELGERRASMSKPVLRGGGGETALKVTALNKEQTLLLRKQATVPYASMLGVVLMGVGLMAIINNWQRVER